MIEIFITNVQDHAAALRLAAAIECAFDNHRANFDLQDCDRILRVCCYDGIVEAAAVIGLLSEEGYYAAILPDE